MDQKVFLNELYFDWLRAFASGYRIGVGVVLNITTHKYIINHITSHIYSIVFHLKDSSPLRSAIELPQTCPKLAQQVPKKCPKRKSNFLTRNTNRESMYRFSIVFNFGQNQVYFLGTFRATVLGTFLDNTFRFFFARHFGQRIWKPVPGTGESKPAGNHRIGSGESFVVAPHQKGL